MRYRTVIGLEVHVQLNTKSKMFCGCSTDFESAPNTNICPVCTGQPGVLPVINRQAVESTIRTGYALKCAIGKNSVFARKNYFYPDLPKNYQISQYELPLCEGGYVDIHADTGSKRIGITRIHLEEDAGKLLHTIGARVLDHSLVDFNRTGIPLMEIVSEPDMHSPEEAYLYLSELKSVLEYLNVSDCSMEQGSLRCDANISVTRDEKLGTKAELKNMNSFKGVRDALEYEVTRQIELLEEGGKVVQETRLWNTDKGISESMRSKEEAHDYRYLPDPDLIPIELPAERLRELKESIPEMPAERLKRLVQECGLTKYDAGVLTSDKKLADFYEKTLGLLIKKCKAEDVAKPLSNWITNELLARLNEAGKTIEDSSIDPGNLAELILLIQDKTISGKIAKTVFNEMFSSGKTANVIVQEKDLVQITDEGALEKFAEEAIAANPKAVSEYKTGKQQAIGALIGFIMKKTQGKANPRSINKILREKLGGA